LSGIWSLFEVEMVVQQSSCHGEVGESEIGILKRRKESV